MIYAPNRSPWARNGKKPPLATPAPEEYVDKQFATAFLVDRDQKPAAEQRALRDKAGKAIDRALKSGVIQQRDEDKKFKFGHLVAWALTKRAYVNAAQGLPALGSARMQLTAPSFSVQISGYGLPADPADYREALVAAYREIGRLREMNATLETRVAQLQPIEDRNIAASRLKSIAGKKGGRPRTAT